MEAIERKFKKQSFTTVTDLRKKALRNNISIINLIKSAYGTKEKSSTEVQRTFRSWDLYGILWEVDTVQLLRGCQSHCPC